jgi:hypothetical protein
VCVCVCVCVCVRRYSMCVVLSVVGKEENIMHANRQTNTFVKNLFDRFIEAKAKWFDRWLERVCVYQLKICTQWALFPFFISFVFAFVSVSRPDNEGNSIERPSHVVSWSLELFFPHFHSLVFPTFVHYLFYKCLRNWIAHCKIRSINDFWIISFIYPWRDATEN